MIDGKKISAVITAAGNGLRMKSNKAKPYIEIMGRKILEISLDTIVKLDQIDQIIVENFLCFWERNKRAFNL